MLHDILQNLVKKQGIKVLESQYLCGMCDDEQAFQSWKERPYRLVLRGMINQGFVSQILAEGVYSEAYAKGLAESFAQSNYAQENGLTSEMAVYVLHSLAFAAKWTSAPAVNNTEELAAGTVATPELKLGEQVVPYHPAAADANPIGTMIPANQCLQVARNLNRIAIEEGDLVEYLSYELQWDAEQVLDVLAAEQIDGVAMAIRQLQVGQGIIISDATGVGKGRQLAALIHWSIVQGCVPTFVTEKSVLFSDLYRDMNDIRCGHYKPFILNTDKEAKVVDAAGKLVVDLPTKQELDFFKDHHQLPPGYDFIVLTYSQMSREQNNWKQAAVLELCKESFLILDESHNASGTDSNQGRFFLEAVKNACGVVFASATYAKNCATMPLYAIKTAIAEARIGSEELIKIVGSGGIILQEELSKGLVASGSMIRRERDMSDIMRSLVYDTDPDHIAKTRKSYDTVIDVIQDMQDWERKFVVPYLKSLDIEEQLRVSNNLPDTFVFEPKSLHIDRESFAQRLMPTIQQLLLATKVDLAVQTTLSELKEGRKPVVEIQRTLESQLDFLVDVGNTLPSFEFSQILKHNLKSMFHYKLEGAEFTGKGKKSNAAKMMGSYSFTLNSLIQFFNNDEPLAGYKYIVNRINEAITGLPVSPIDYFVYHIEKAGYKVAEMTQRKSYLKYEGSNGACERLRRVKPDKKKIANDFNNGAVDVLIANRMAATGISLHASQTFKDQRQRVMIILEDQASADLSEQFAGRIDRTGQVERGCYITLSSSIASERRFMMMNEHKQRSLSSMVRADQRTAVDMGVTDILNMYGSQVVDEYLKDHLELFDMMSDLRDQRSSYRDDSALVSKFMRALALLRCDDQDRVLNDIESRYKELIQELNETGENELEAQILPIEAKLLNRFEFASGNPNSQSVFGKPAYLDEVQAKILRKPMTGEEIQHLSRQLIDPQRVIDRCIDAQQKKIEALHVRYEKLRTEALAKLAEIERQPEAQHYTPSRLKQIYEAANNAEKRQEQEEKIQEDFREIRRLLNSFSKRQAVGVPMSLEAGEISAEQMIDFVSVGLFLGVKVTGDSITRSSVKLVFAVNDGRRRLEIPLTRAGEIETIRSQTQLQIMKPRLKGVNFSTWDSLCPKQAYEKLYIITGNILLGIYKAGQFGSSVSDNRLKRFAQAKGRGRLIIYSDVMGKIKHGYLMPKIFRPQDLMTYGC